jgi:uncharacterized damage-inducible protein DinB
MSQTEFLERSRYYLAQEYPAKIRLAVTPLTNAQVWQRANEDSNSIGNLLLHLSGNVRQWIVSGMGDAPDVRDRSSEFSAREGRGKSELLDLLDSAVHDADQVLAALSEADLERNVTIQGRDTSVFAAIYHVVEHFSTHTGQIILLAKIHAPGRVRFYEDAGGLAIPLWGGSERVSSGGGKPAK